MSWRSFLWQSFQCSNYKVGPDLREGLDQTTYFYGTVLHPSLLCDSIWRKPFFTVIHSKWYITAWPYKVFPKCFSNLHQQVLVLEYVVLHRIMYIRSTQYFLIENVLQTLVGPNFPACFLLNLHTADALFVDHFR